MPESLCRSAALPEGGLHASGAGKPAKQAGWIPAYRSQPARLVPGVLAETADLSVSNVKAASSGAQIQHTETAREIV